MSELYYYKFRKNCKYLKYVEIVLFVEINQKA